MVVPPPQSITAFFEGSQLESAVVGVVAGSVGLVMGSEGFVAGRVGSVTGSVGFVVFSVSASLFLRLSARKRTKSLLP